MEVTDIQIIKNADVKSSNIKKTIVMRVEIEDLETRSTKSLEGFSDRLKSLLPGLYTHKDFRGNSGVGFQKLDEGVCITDVVAYISVELQRLAGMNVHFSTVDTTDSPGVYNVVVDSIDEEIGMYAILASVEITEALIKDKLYFIRHDIDRLKCLYEQSKYTAAKKDSIQSKINIPVIKLSTQTVSLTSDVKTA